MNPHLLAAALSGRTCTYSRTHIRPFKVSKRVYAFGMHVVPHGGTLVLVLILLPSFPFQNLKIGFPLGLLTCVSHLSPSSTIPPYINNNNLSPLILLHQNHSTIINSSSSSPQHFPLGSSFSLSIHTRPAHQWGSTTAAWAHHRPWGRRTTGGCHRRRRGPR